MNPPKRITDPTFVYTNSVETDLRRTFARIRRELQRRESALLPKPANVQPITRARKV